MSEDVAAAKTLLKQAKENLKKAEENCYNEKVRAEFGKRSQELLDATKEGKNSITFTVALNKQETMALKDLFLKEGLSVYTFLMDTFGGVRPSWVWDFPDWCNYYKKPRSDKNTVTFTISVP